MTQSQDEAAKVGLDERQAAHDVYVFPTSFAQQRLWFLHQLAPQSASYNIARAMRLFGRLDVGVLSRALTEIVRRHEILRTTFGLIDGQPMQIIAPEPSIRPRIVDLSALSPAARESEARQLFTVEARRPFDLRRGPLLRVAILRLSEEDYIPLFTMHHIISDAWSVSVFVKELTAFYGAFSSGAEPRLAELPIQFADYAEWQREYLQGEVLNGQLDYWRRQLGDAPTMLELPTDRPRPRVQSDSGATFPFNLGTELPIALKELSQRNGVTLFMTLLAAFNVLLSRYSGQSQVCVGTPIAGRTRPETEELIGLFLNTLVLKTDLSGQPRFTELLARERETCLGAYAHQDVPFERVVQELHTERSLSHSPLFQVIFTLQNAPAREPELPGLQLCSFLGDARTAKVDLTLTMSEDVNTLLGAISYNTDLFDEGTISRLAEQFRTLLAGIVVDPERRISELPIMTREARRQLLVEWNDTARDTVATSTGVCVQNLFEAHAARTPDAVAVASAAGEVTYGELNRRANRLAHRLRRLGIRPEVTVGLLLGRTARGVMAQLAVLKAGGAFVPLDPQEPAERLGSLLDDAQAEVLLTERDLAEQLPDCRARVVCLDEEGNEAEQPADGTSATSAVEENPVPLSAPQNLAYVVYTSGSTGKPKGVAVEHCGLWNLVGWHVDTYGVTRDDRATLVAGPAFDAAVWELWPYLCAGGSLHIPDEGTRASPPALVDWLAAQRITISFLPTPLAEAVLEEQWPRSTRLRFLLTGGDRLRRPPNSDIPFVLFNNYGPTESTVVATATRIPPDGSEATSSAKDAAGANIINPEKVDADRRNSRLPIGRPIYNVRAYLLDEWMHPAPLGALGEIYLGGIGVARCYLRRPDLTAERFVPDPFSTEVGARVYQTGDLARYLPDGQIEFLGRTDDQVKLRGHRVEVAEVEAVLAQHPNVGEAVVLAREDVPGHKRLVAYIVQASGNVAAADLREYLKKKLPDYMVPTAFVTLAGLPLTSNGKIDRKSLPSPDSAGNVAQGAFVGARNAVEGQLAEVWQQALGIERVGVHDNFFELGGDSIVSIQIVARANRAGLRMTPRQLFEHQTIAELAAVIAENATAAKAEKAERAAPPVEAKEEAAPRDVPLTPIQHWFFAREFKQPHHWNQSLLLAVRGPVRGRALTQAFATLVRRHAALRLRFARDERARWRQRVLPPEAATASEQALVHQVDLSLIAAGERVRMLERCCSEVQRSLDLDAGPLMRLALFSLGETRGQRLLAVGHHLITDGVSWRILLSELRHDYEEEIGGNALSTAPVAASFVDWAVRLATYAGSDEIEAQIPYWQAAERAAREFRLPGLSGVEVNTEASMAQITVRLDAERTRALLQDVPRVYRTQIDDALLAALGRALSRWTGRRRVVINLERHGREPVGESEMDVAGAVGWFTSVCPVTLEAEWSASGEALKSVKEQLRRVPGKGIGYGVWRYLRAEGEGQKGGEVSFNYHGQLDTVLGKEGPFEPASEWPGEPRGAAEVRPYKLGVVGSVREGELVMAWKYGRKLHRQKTIQAVADSFIESLKEIIEHCRVVEAVGVTPSDFPLVDLKQQQLDKILSRVGKGRLA